jgi:hypothetical protein
MVRMSAVWDRTVEVLNGRAGILAAIALLTIAIPSIIQSAVGGGMQAVPSLAGGIVGLVAFGLTLWGTLAMTAVASDPATGRAQGLRIGARALPRTLAVMLVLGIALVLLWVPAIALLMGSGYDLAAAQRGDQVGAMANVRAGPVVLYSLVATAVMIWLFARLVLIYPVLVNEGLMFGALRRSFALTRGLTARIVGVMILFLVVLVVAVLATQGVFGTAFRLLLGAEQQKLALVMTAAVLAVVTTGFSVLQIVFAAQLYVATRAPVEVEPAPVRSGPWA